MGQPRSAEQRCDAPPAPATVRLLAWMGLTGIAILTVGFNYGLDPLVGVGTAVVFLGEVLQWGQVWGGLIALVGMWLAASNAPSKPRH